MFRIQKLPPCNGGLPDPDIIVDCRTETAVPLDVMLRALNREQAAEKLAASVTDLLEKLACDKRIKDCFALTKDTGIALIEFTTSLDLSERLHESQR